MFIRLIKKPPTPPPAMAAIMLVRIFMVTPNRTGSVMPQTAVIPVAEVSCLEFGVLGLDGNGQSSSALCHVGGQLARIDDGIKADGHTVVDANGGQGVVGTCHDQERQEHADDGGHQPGVPGCSGH